MQTWTTTNALLQLLLWVAYECMHTAQRGLKYQKQLNPLSYQTRTHLLLCKLCEHLLLQEQPSQLNILLMKCNLRIIRVPQASDCSPTNAALPKSLHCEFYIYCCQTSTQRKFHHRGYLIHNYLD